MSGFLFAGQRIPLVNPQRGIFKPRQMAGLLSIRTVFPHRGRIWYDDQRDAHRRIYVGDDTVEYAFMGSDPAASTSVDRGISSFMASLSYFDRFTASATRVLRSVPASADRARR